MGNYYEKSSISLAIREMMINELSVSQNGYYQTTRTTETNASEDMEKKKLTLFWRMQISAATMTTIWKFLKN